MGKYRPSRDRITRTEDQRQHPQMDNETQQMTKDIRSQLLFFFALPLSIVILSLSNGISTSCLASSLQRS